MSSLFSCLGWVAIRKQKNKREIHTWEDDEDHFLAQSTFTAPFTWFRIPYLVLRASAARWCNVQHTHATSALLEMTAVCIRAHTFSFHPISFDKISLWGKILTVLILIIELSMLYRGRSNQMDCIKINDMNESSFISSNLGFFSSNKVEEKYMYVPKL